MQRRGSKKSVQLNRKIRFVSKTLSPFSSSPLRNEASSGYRQVFVHKPLRIQRSDFTLNIDMASSTVNVVRYSALLTGVFYGIVHRRTLQAQENVKKERHAEERREELLTRAQQAWRDKQSAHKDNVITNPEDPNFDLEKLLAKWEKDS